MVSLNVRNTVLILSLCVAALVGCAEPPQPEVKSEPEPPAVPEATTVLMGAFFERVTAAQAAIVRGDLEGVREPAVWIAEHESIAGLSLPVEQWSSETREGWEAHNSKIRDAARLISEAGNFEEAAAASARMVRECGNCHQQVGAEPRIPELGAIGIPPTESVATIPHMLRHQWAVHQMWIGLINPSDDAWQKGAEVLSGVALRKENLSPYAEYTENLSDLALRVHELGEQALETPDWSLRADIYGELLASCAGCHYKLGKGPR